MDAPPEQSKPRPSRVKRFFRIALFIVVCLVTLVALAITEENWRGKRDWEKFKRESEARGERFDLASVVPPKVPDDQNFAKAPIFAGAFNVKADPKTGDLIAIDPNISDRLQIRVFSIMGDAARPPRVPNPTFGGWQQAKKTELKEWQTYYRAIAAATNEFPVAAKAQTPASDVR